MRCPFSLGMRQKTVEREREREKCIDNLGEMETLVGGGMGPLFHQRAFKETRTESGPQMMSEGGKAVGETEGEPGVSRPSGSPTSGRRAAPSPQPLPPRRPVSKPLGVLLAVLLHGKLCPWPMLPPHLTTGRGKGAPPSAPLEWVLKPQPDRKTQLLRKMVLTNFVGKENDNSCNKSQRKLVSPVSLARDLSHPKSGSTRPPRPPCPAPGLLNRHEPRSLTGGSRRLWGNRALLFLSLLYSSSHQRTSNPGASLTLGDCSVHQLSRFEKRDVTETTSF